MKHSEYNRRFAEVLSREMNGRTLKEYADDLNISKSTLQSWLNGVRSPTLANAVRVAGLLGVSPREIVPEKLS